MELPRSSKDRRHDAAPGKLTEVLNDVELGMDYLLAITNGHRSVRIQPPRPKVHIELLVRPGA